MENKIPKKLLKSSYRIRTKHINFRPIEPEDAKYTFEEVNDNLTEYWIGWEPSKDMQEEMRVIEGKIKLSKDFPPSIEFIVFDNFNNFVGCCGISPSEEKEEFEVNLWVKTSEQGKGYGKEMLNMVLSWTKENTDLNYLIYSVTKGNLRSFAIINKMGILPYRTLSYTKREKEKMVTDYKILLK